MSTQSYKGSWSRAQKKLVSKVSIKKFRWDKLSFNEYLTKPFWNSPYNNQN